MSEQVKINVLERVGEVKCPKCGGAGRRWKRNCRYCEGKGRINVLGIVTRAESAHEVKE